LKITCNRLALHQAVQTVQKAVSAKAQLSVLSGIYLAAADGQLELQATDYELGISCKIAADIQLPGKVVIAARYFQELVRKLSGETIQIELSTAERSVQITSGSSTFNLLCMPVEEFPVLKPLINDQPIRLQTTILRELIQKTIFACSNDESRPIFTGALLLIEEGTITMVATNTHRMAYKKDTAASEHPLKMIIPAKMLSELGRIMPAGDENVTIYNLKNQVAFVFDNVYFLSRIIEGQFPDFNRVIPTQFNTTVQLKTDDFLAAVERVSLLSSSGDYNVVRVEVTADSLLVRSNNPDVGKAVEQVAATVDGQQFEIAFNARYVTDILKHLDDPECIFQLIAPLSPASIKPLTDADYVYIITPVRTA